MKFIDLLYLLVFIMFIGEGVAIATGMTDATVFVASKNSFFVAAWILIAYMNMKNNKSK